MRRDAALFGLWLLVLGLCLHFGRGVQPWFEGARGELAAWALGLAGAGGGGWLAVRAWRGLPPGRRRRAGWLLAGVAAALALLAWAQPLLIERTHLFLYGVLGLLSWRLLGHWLAGWRRAAWAAALAGGVGWLDELGQWLHPERVYDWRDVGTNAAAAALAVLAAWALRAEP